MAYNEKLAERVRELLIGHAPFDERKMFGGLAFMVNDKMCIGILQNKLMARINPYFYEMALQKKGCKEMDFTGRPMKGFVFISPEGTSTKRDLQYWIGLALEFNKQAKISKSRKKRRFTIKKTVVK